MTAPDTGSGGSGAARGPVRGLVRRAASRSTFEHQLWPAPPELAPWVEHLWSVEWDLRGQPPRTSRVITFPASNLTAEWGSGTRHGHRLPATLVHGVVTAVFEVELSGRGGVVGARFRPDGLSAWSGEDAAELTDRVLAAGDVLGPAYAELHLDVVTRDTARARADVLVEALVRDQARSRPPQRDRLADLIDRLAADETITRVEQLAELSGWTQRTLQRRFRREIGVSPKWVLVRFRLQQAALALETDPGTELAELAVSLGWYDQAHLTSDFTWMLGETPGEYAGRVRARQPA